MDDFLQNHKNIKSLLFIIGFLWAFSKLIKIPYKIIRHFLKRHRNLLKRYGENSYALVTGASDGIGQKFSLKLAQRGFNICLIARNAQKLERVVEEIKKINPKVQTKIIIADFTNSATDEKFFDRIEEQIRNIDVSILINNAGIDVFEEYHKLSHEEIKNIIVVNCIPMSILTKCLIPHMRIRKNRSAIINVSSFTGVIPMPYYNIYSASKAFNDFLTRAVAVEYPSIDFLSLRPSDVSTQMTFYRKTDFFTITAEECVEGCLRDVGHETVTYGSWKHKLQGYLYSLVSYDIFIWFYKKLYAPGIFAERLANKKII